MSNDKDHETLSDRIRAIDAEIAEDRAAMQGGLAALAALSGAVPGAFAKPPEQTLPPPSKPAPSGRVEVEVEDVIDATVNNDSLRSAKARAVRSVRLGETVLVGVLSNFIETWHPAIVTHVYGPSDGGSDERIDCSLISRDQLTIRPLKRVPRGSTPKSGLSTWKFIDE